MPIEIDPFWKPADPIWALAIGLALIATIAALAYLPARNFVEPLRSRYMRTLALAAEILVSVGIIGLITLAARTKIDSEIRRSEATTQELQAQATYAAWTFAKKRCLTTPNPPPSSESETQTIADACAMLAELFEPDDVNWFFTKDKLYRLSRVHGIQKELSADFATISDKIDSLVRAQNKLTLDKHKKKLLEDDVSWIFIFVSTLLAVIGVALKWARATLDLTRCAETKK